MSNATYPYRVNYPRTADWYSGHWRELSTWCDECITAGEWNYYGDSFVFAYEKDYMLFKLRWL